MFECLNVLLLEYFDDADSAFHLISRGRGRHKKLPLRRRIMPYGGGMIVVCWERWGENLTPRPLPYS
jgi:hypothetical protein